MVKNLKKSFLRNQKANDLETLYRVLEYYQVCSNDDSVMTLFYCKVKFGPLWEKGKTMDFSETIVVYGVKVGRCS